MTFCVFMCFVEPCAIVQATEDELDGSDSFVRRGMGLSMGLNHWLSPLRWWGLGTGVANPPTECQRLLVTNRRSRSQGWLLVLSIYFLFVYIL